MRFARSDASRRTGGLSRAVLLGSLGGIVPLLADSSSPTSGPPIVTIVVVGQGTFTWEPAVMQLIGAPEMLAFVPRTSIEVVGAP